MAHSAALPDAHGAAAPVTGARLVVEALEREGVRYVFGYPGGAIMPVYDALPGSNLSTSWSVTNRPRRSPPMPGDA